MATYQKVIDNQPEGVSLTEYQVRSAISARNGAIFPQGDTPDNPLYAANGYYPESKPDLLRFQVYDVANSVYSDGVVVVPVIEGDIGSARDNAIAGINAMSETRLNGGFAYDGAQFKSDAEGMTNLNGIGAAVANNIPLPANFAWVDAAGVPHAMDVPGFLQFAAAAMAFRQNVYTLTWTLRGQVAAAQDNAAIRAILDGAQAQFDSIL